MRDINYIKTFIELEKISFADRSKYLGDPDFYNTDFYDYEAKYTNGASEHIIPAKIPSSISKLVQEISLKAHKIFKCKGVTRSDFRFDENFGSDGLFILEINTQPGMTSTSLVPELFSRIGFSFNDLVISLLEDASCNR